MAMLVLGVKAAFALGFIAGLLEFIPTVGPILAAVPAIAGMSDAQKQAQAERTAYLTMVAGSAYQELKGGGQPARLADLQRNVRASLLRSGIDLERLALTEDGLVAR